MKSSKLFRCVNWEIYLHNELKLSEDIIKDTVFDYEKEFNSERLLFSIKRNMKKNIKPYHRTNDRLRNLAILKC